MSVAKPSSPLCMASCSTSRQKSAMTTSGNWREHLTSGMSVLPASVQTMLTGTIGRNMHLAVLIVPRSET